MNWTVQYAEYYLYRGVSRTNAYEFMQQSGSTGGEAMNTIRRLRGLVLAGVVALSAAGGC